MARRKRARGAVPVADMPREANGRRLTARTVGNPYGNGVDLVACVPDTVAILHGRGKIDDRQAAAAERYRRAAEAVGASLTATAALERVDSTGGAGQASERRLLAARDLATAQAVLGRHEWVVRVVVAEGRALGDVAARLPGGDCRDNRSAASVMLRESLAHLADVWEPVARGTGRPVTEGA